MSALSSAMNAAPAGAFLGIDVGGTNIKSVLLADAGGGLQVIRRTEAPTSRSTPDEVLDQVAAIARDHLTDGPVPLRLGFCLPGAIDRRAGTAGVMPNLPGSWRGLSVRDMVADRAGLPTSVVNDARAFTVAESRLGAGRGLETVVGVTLGTGLGGGVVINGSLHEGASGFAGELGHQIVQVDGDACGCGNRGCAETYVSSTRLLGATRLPSVRAVFEHAAAGDPVAVAAVERYVSALAVALANVHTLLCPDAFVIGGGIAAAGAPLLDPLLERIRALITFDRPDSVQLRQAQLGSIAGAIGAALVADDGQPRGEPGWIESPPVAAPSEDPVGGTRAQQSMNNGGR
jgi:glucokinase